MFLLSQIDHVHHNNFINIIKTGGILDTPEKMVLSLGHILKSSRSSGML